MKDHHLELGRMVLNAVGDVLDGLPPEVRRVVRASVKWEVRRRPLPSDLALGAKASDRGLFVGHPYRGADEDEGGELYAAEGDDVATAQGLPAVYADEGDDVAEVVEEKPGGVIVLFLDNIVPLTETALVDVVLHELGHFLGETEEGNAELGLG